MVDVQHWLAALPPGLICLLVGVVIGVESMGIPLPGEIVLVSAALLAATGVVGPEWVAAAAATGAILGDSIGTPWADAADVRCWNGSAGASRNTSARHTWPAPS
ncbi:hypothetical protein V2I01_00780 [Micromonospora sp. BRA006-A]|nr:hypothetical protein [Micromonospora sp. BRA006-A]